MQEPTEAEMIRALGTKVDLMTESLNRLAATLGNYVTQERYASDQRLAELKHDQLASEVKADKARTDANRRLALSAFIAPLIVGLVIWYLTQGGA